MGLIIYPDGEFLTSQAKREKDDAKFANSMFMFGAIQWRSRHPWTTHSGYNARSISWNLKKG